jgi:cysteine-rich repeat protein
MLGDTQRYTNNRPCIFDCETEWIKANKDVFKIKYAIQVGDITDDGDSDLEFSRAKKSMCVLNGTNVETPIVPYSLARGNHDNLTDYNRYFPLEMYDKWCANDDCIVTPNGGVEFSAHPFTAGGGDWLVVLLDWTPPTTANPPDQPEASPSLEFANWIVEQPENVDKRVIVVTHAFLHLDGEHYESNIWDDFADLHPNVFFIFSGHYPNNFGPSVAQRVATNSQGNRVFQFVADHQSDPDRDGTVELLTICPSPGRVLVKSYSPFFDRCFTSADGDPDFQFEWPPTTPPIDFSLACGDGFVGGSEQCDDGNTSSADCCSSTCTCQVGASGACTCGLTCGQAGSLCKCGY